MILLLVAIISIGLHEMGHYAAYRAMGIVAEKFAIGFGPRLLWWTDRRGTQWSIRLIPLGGFVALPEWWNERASPFAKAFGAACGPTVTLFVASASLSACTVYPTHAFLLAAYMNATMGIFNLLPIPPLDGGQILLAFLENRLGRWWVKQHEDRFYRSGFFMVMGFTFLILGSGWQMMPDDKHSSASNPRNSAAGPKGQMVLKHSIKWPSQPFRLSD